MTLGNNVNTYGDRSWPKDDEYDGDGGGGFGSMSEEERRWRFRFKIPEPKDNPLQAGRPMTKRVLILDEEPPFRIYEHGLYKANVADPMGHWTVMCLARNDIDERGCPLCAKNGADNWPYNIGFFTIVDFGQVEYVGSQVKFHPNFWQNKDGERQEKPFETVMLGAKRGSRDKPGVLQTLQWQAEKRGGTLAGTVWDTTRKGRKEARCGETWEYVERIDLAEAAEYLAALGADRDSLDLDVTDYRKVCRPLSYETLCRMVGWRSDGKQQGTAQRTEGAGYDGDEDLPF